MGTLYSSKGRKSIHSDVIMIPPRQKPAISTWFGQLNYLQKVIVFAILLGIIFAGGLLFLESREERFTSLYLRPDSYTNYPQGNITSFTYGIRSFERERMSYDFRILIGNQTVNSTRQELDPGEVVEKNMTLDLTGVTLPTQLRLLLVSGHDSYEVHYWLKETPPVAAFIAEPIQGKEPLSVNFTDLSTKSPSNWTWKFGDETTSYLRNPSHTYSGGTYTVTLIVANSGGSSEEVRDNYINVIPLKPPAAAFLADITTGAEPLLVNFTDQSTNSPTAWRWEFGDGTLSALQNPSHSFSAGNYTVNLTVSNSDGIDTETREHFISVFQRNPPIAAFSADITAGTEPLTVQFTDESENRPQTWTWNFGDGATSRLRNPTHTYTNGVYAVTLTVTNEDGADKATRENYIVVAPRIQTE